MSSANTDHRTIVTVHAMYVFDAYALDTIQAATCAWTASCTSVYMATLSMSAALQPQCTNYRRRLMPSEFRADHATFKDFTDSDIETELSVGMWLKRRSSWFHRLRYVRSDEDCEKLVQSVAGMNEDFTFSVSFSPVLVAGVCKQGFLPMAIQAAADFAVLAPKLHKHRCIMDFADLHIPKSVIKKAKKYKITVDECFDFCLQSCCTQHGEHCWFYPALINAYRHIFECGGLNGVKMHSIEVWAGDDVVAGEVGYAVGGVYTSLSGFTLQDSAGTVQCCAVPKLLKACGFAFWDLGMALKYKEDIGGRSVPRKVFLERFRSVRSNDGIVLTCPDHGNAREILRLS